MIKSISFLPQFIPLIKSGKKTVTRRFKTKLKDGDIVYFKIGRTGKKEGYIKIISVKIEPLKDIIYSYGKEEPQKEGCKDLRDFMRVWDSIHGFSSWRDNPGIYRIEFKHLGKELKQLLKESEE